MKYFSYISKSQSPETEQAQREAVEAWCREHGVPCDAEIKETPQGKGKLATLLEPLSPGDTLIASELASLGKSLSAIRDILEYALERGVTICTAAENYRLCSADDPICETLRSAVAIQRRITTVRTRDALQAAASRGRRGGRPSGAVPPEQLKLNAYRDQIQEMLSQGLTRAQIAQRLHCDRHTLSTFLARASK